MQELIRGANWPLAASGKVRIRLNWRGAPGALDFACFALDAHERVPGDAWFLFYNQPTSPGDAIRLDPRHAEFLIELDALPAAVRKCVFIATPSDAGSTAVDEIVFSAMMPMGGGGILFRPTEPMNGRALLLAELYHHHETWKIRAKGEGLKHDLAALAHAFGVDVVGDTHHAGAAGGHAIRDSADPPPGARPTRASPPPVVAPKAPTAPADHRVTPPTIAAPAPPSGQPPATTRGTASATAPDRPPDSAVPPTPTGTAGPLAAPAHDRHEKLKTYATLAIAFGSLTTAITTLVTQCISHPAPPVVVVQPTTIQQPAAPPTPSTARAPAPMPPNAPSSPLSPPASWNNR